MGRVLKNSVARNELREQLYAKADSGNLVPQEAIAGIRKISGLTQVQFALRIGVSLGTLKALEQGTANPTLATLSKILKLGNFRIVVGRQPNEN
jgi:DNA-binding transcriptional regulator YiaG